MTSVGGHLRALRERRGLSLDEISRATRVASRYLEALEADRFAALPAPVFTRGFILAYCQALGESSDEALGLFDGREGVGTTAPKPTVAPAAPRAPVAEAAPRSRSAVLVSFVLLVILGMALFAVALMTQPAREQRVDTAIPPLAEAPAAAPTSPPATAAADPAPPSAPTSIPPPKPPAVVTSPTAPSSTPVPAGAVITPEPSRAAAPPPAWLPGVQAATGGVGSPYRLIARASEATWIRVR